MTNKIKRTFRKIKYLPLNIICSLFPMKNEIILESHPDLSCNTYALFRYFLKVKLNQQYKIIWIVNEPDKYKDLVYENVEFVDICPNTMISKFLFYKKCNRAKVMITCNRHRAKTCVANKQINIYLDHGSHMKNMLKYNRRRVIDCDYLMCQSSFFVKYNLEQYDITENQIICTGLPRNDELFVDNHSIETLIPNCSEYNKIILWVPTFRQHNTGERIDCDVDFPLGLPVVYTEKDLVILNEKLMEYKVLLIIKPHPAQNMEIIKEFSSNNIVFLYNKDLAQNNIQLNELLQQTDAMITDYSSVYHDYLLLDKPIAITLDDFRMYENQKGFVFEDVLSVLKGEYVYNTRDLCTFIVNVAEERDEKKEERLEVKKRTHDYYDGESSKRVYEFLMQKLGVHTNR